MSDENSIIQMVRTAPLSGQPFRRVLIFFIAAAAIWAVLAGAIMRWVVEDRAAAYLAQERNDIEKRLVAVSSQFDLALNRLRGVSAVVADDRGLINALSEYGTDATRSTQPIEVRKKNLTGRSDLQALGRQFAQTALALEVDVIWAMNAGGDCVAASNFNALTSFVGVNFSDRKYFTAPQAGERGYQYAMGRVTNIPGLFFSSPVNTEKGFLGVVAVKIDLPRLAPWIDGIDEFVTDENGVIILAGNSERVMNVVDASIAQHLTVAQREARYKRTEFKSLGIEELPGRTGLVKVSGSGVPHFFRSSGNTPERLRVHILKPAHNLDIIRRDGIALFALLTFAGVLVAALLAGAYIYVVRIRQHQTSMQTTNDTLSRLNQDLERLSRTDSLTGCANRGYFQERMIGEVGRARRYGRPCSVLILDIDWFKKINDQLGHAAGDDALRHIVTIISSTVRGQDIVARLGGEEFAVLMPETGIENALALAERLRLAIASSPAKFGDVAIPMTVSIGVAQTMMDREDEKADIVLRNADEALYAAKGAGRNRVMSKAPSAA